MAEWVVCPQCQLKHSRRADGQCPRCHAETAPPSEEARPVAPAPPPAAPPASVHPPRPTHRSAPHRRGAQESEAESLPDVYDGRPAGEPRLGSFGSAPSSDLPLSARIGGGIMVANGLALLVEAGLGATMSEPGQAPLPFKPSPIAMLIDLVLGGMLLTGNLRALPWAKVRVVLGALVLPALFLAKGQTFLAGLQVSFLVGLAILLFGDAGRIRIGVGLLATGLVLALETVGLFGLLTGTSPLARLQLAPTLEGQPVEDVEGVACAWHLSVPGRGWYLRKAEAAARENPLADRWLVRPDRDAHVIVIAERIDPDILVDIDRFAEVVLGNVRESAPDVEILDRQDLHAGGTRIHTRGTINSLRIESYYGLFAREPWIFQVVGFTGERQFDSVEGELANIIASFEAPAL